MRVDRFDEYNHNELVWIHGLPGSGKTSLANEINKNNEYVILDDVFKISVVEEELKKEKNIILSSPYFENYIGLSLDKQLKTLLENYDYHIEEIWFENNPKQCIENLRNRTEHGLKSNSIIPEIDYYSMNYKIPSSVKTFPVWSKK